MAAPTREDMFNGRVTEREYSQFVAKETVPSTYIDGVPVSWTTNTYTARYKEQTFTFEGLTEAQANDTTAITVTDASGVQYTFTPQASITDGSSGSASFERQAVEVERSMMSPHMYKLIVTRRGGELRKNNAVEIYAPTWTGWSS